MFKISLPLSLKGDFFPIMHRLFNSMQAIPKEFHFFKIYKFQENTREQQNVFKKTIHHINGQLSKDNDLFAKKLTEILKLRYI